MKLSTFLCVLLGLMAAAVQAQNSKHSGFVHDWLIWFEAFALQHIWLPLTWWGFYKYMPGLVCGLGLQDQMFDLLGTSLPGINNVTAKAAVKASAEKTCKDGFEKMYNNVWYFNDKKKLIDGDFDYYNYDPSKL